jgi:hypothetical protein
VDIARDTAQMSTTGPVGISGGSFRWDMACAFDSPSRWVSFSLGARLLEYLVVRLIRHEYDNEYQP